jgi:putative chitinase
MTSDELRRCMPYAKQTVINDFIDPLNAAMQEFSIDESIDRECHFLAQIAHESSNLNSISENLNYSADGLLNRFSKYFTPEEAADYARQPERIANRVYANRMGNRDEASGDGWRYRGAGLIQTTGFNNQNRVAEFFALPVDGIGDWLRTEEGASRSAGLFWKENGLNALADADDLRGISAIINTGRRTTPIEHINGYTEREMYLKRVRAVLA